MSLTLRDAQHLCWKMFKKFETFDPKSTAAFTNADYLTKKAEEITRKITAKDNSGTAAGGEAVENLLSELLFAAFVLAEQQGVDLEEAFLQATNDMFLKFAT